MRAEEMVCVCVNTNRLAAFRTSLCPGSCAAGEGISAASLSPSLGCGLPSRRCSDLFENKQTWPLLPRAEPVLAVTVVESEGTPRDTRPGWPVTHCPLRLLGGSF